MSQITLSGFGGGMSPSDHHHPNNNNNNLITLERRLKTLSSHLININTPNNIDNIDNLSVVATSGDESLLKFNLTSGSDVEQQTTTTAILMNKFPKGMIEESDFKIVKVDLEQPSPTSGGGDWIVIKLLQLSVDPYMRARMAPKTPKGYFPAFKLNEPLHGGCIVKVLSSSSGSKKYKKGDLLFGYFNWQLIQKVQVTNKFETNYQIVRIDSKLKVPSSYYLGILGMPGITAYHGFLDICQPKKGEVVVVSAASGAVGSIVGQIAKLKGCFVIGISGGGSQDSIKEELKSVGFDSLLNYKDYPTAFALKSAIEKVSPTKEVDCYFDNVGGYILDAVSMCMAKYGRMSLCGAISQYNDGTPEMGPRMNSLYVVRELKVQGFLISSYQSRYEEAVQQLAQWIVEGKLKALETVVKGFENTPKAIIRLFSSTAAGGEQKIGKLIVDCE